MFQIATPNRATMSVLGMYEYDDTLFSQLNLPDGVDADTVVNNILDTCAELELLYPDLPYLKRAIGYWSAKELPFWERVREMETAEYNPIENYDRYDSEVENTGRNRKDSEVENAGRNHSGADNTVVSGNTKSKAHDSAVTTDDSINKVAGYNSDTLAVNGQNSNSNVANSTTENDTTGTTVQSHNDNTNESENRVKTASADEAENRVKSLHSHGNIGVTTVAQMMAEMVKVLPEVNTVNVIAESFKRRFCLLVY